MTSNLNRRDFLKVTGLVAPVVFASSCSSPKPAATGAFERGGTALRIRPVLVAAVYERQEATSWRPWGGLHSRDDIDREAGKIRDELKALAAKADFPLEILEPLLIDDAAKAEAFRAEDCDLVLVYAAAGEQRWLELAANAGKPAVMFIRHRSGPVYLWYETAHPRFLRKTTDDYLEPGMDVWDVVVDDYEEVLWRLRGLFGLKNTLGTRILSIGPASGWGRDGQDAPAHARDIFKLDIRDIAYEELDRLIQKAFADQALMGKCRQDAEAYLSQEGVSLHTEKEFVVNGFMLAEIFRELMRREGAQAITVQGCMNTIIPKARTTACLTLSLINDEGPMAFCESDFVVIPSGILMRYISGKPSFLQDPTHPHAGVVTVAHCTAPRRMNGVDLEPARVVTHFESDYGATPKVLMRKGQVTTNVAPDFSFKRWVGFRGTIIDHPDYDICRSQIDLAIDGDWRELLERMQGFHWMTCYGDYLNEVGYALKKVGIQWQNVSAGDSKPGSIA